MSNGLLTRIDKPNFMMDNWGKTETATVQQGESNLSEVAKRLGISLQALLEANPQIKDPGQLTPGHELNLPEKQSVVPLLPSPAAPRSEPDSASGYITGERDLQGVMMRASLEAFFRTGDAEEKPAAESKDANRRSIFDDDIDEPEVPYKETIAGIVEATISMGNRMSTLDSRLDAAKVPAKLRDELRAQLSKQGGSDLNLLDQVDAALASKDPSGAIKSMVIQGRVKDYYSSFESTYEINGKTGESCSAFPDHGRFQRTARTPSRNTCSE
ncbi:LysM domain-containing protein [bacterium]|nr:LysM domain-containing protein [bacterium]